MSSSERDEVLARLSRAATNLSLKTDLRLIPGQGLSFGFARKHARDADAVAAVQGGLRRNGHGGIRVEGVRFGSDSEVARMILTAMRFDPAMRSAATLRCTPPIFNCLESLFFEVCTFDPAKEPPAITTMDWGVASCCRKGVPDVIANKPSAGRPALLRFFGEVPPDVATNIIMLSNRVINIEI